MVRINEKNFSATDIMNKLICPAIKLSVWSDMIQIREKVKSHIGL